MSKNKLHSVCVTASTTRANVESTQKIHAASSNPTSSCRLCKSVENSARHNSAFLYLLKFPDPVSNVEGIMVGMIKLHYAIEKGLSKVALRETEIHKIAQIAQLNQLFQLLHLAHIYGHCFYLVSRMLMSKNVNNDVSKDSPIVDALSLSYCLLIFVVL